MKLRDYPALKKRGRSLWPPRWNTMSSGPAIQGEVGVLKYVHANPNVSQLCYLVIEHEGHHYIGEIIFDDKNLAEKVITLLRNNVGRTIEAIGDIIIAT